MPKTDWSDILREHLATADASPRKPTTLSEEACLDGFAEQFAEKMRRNAAETERGIAIMQAHIAQNDGGLDVGDLTRMLDRGPSGAIN